MAYKKKVHNFKKSSFETGDEKQSMNSLAKIKQIRVFKKPKGLRK